MAPILGLIVIGVTLAVLIFAGEQESIAGFAVDDVARFGALGALFVFILMGSGILRHHAIRDIVNGLIFWAGLCATLVLAYTLFYGERVTPGMIWSRLTEKNQQVVEGPGHAVAIRAQGSQFIAEASINGASLSLLVDTGATTVALSHEDAVKAGIDTDGLNYFIPVETANGRTMAAPMMLEKVSVGPIVVEDVRAVVAQPGTLRFSLLGMTFLNRLSSYEVSRNRLVLKQ